MGPRQILLTVIFALHWIGFVVLLVRQKRLSLLLPIAVFTLLVLTQLLWHSSVVLELGALGPSPLPTVLRAGAIVLAVPSIGLLIRRFVLQRRERVAAGYD
jgi:hypothetical protein